ncbi:hypothetical protein ACQ9AQ_21780, partial [Escherichia coli]
MKGNDPVVINGYGCPDLRFVDNSDRLYIIAHGNTAIIGDGMHGTKEGANKQVISSQADSLIKISRIWAD